MQVSMHAYSIPPQYYRRTNTDTSQWVTRVGEEEEEADEEEEVLYTERVYFLS